MGKESLCRNGAPQVRLPKLAKASTQPELTQSLLHSGSHAQQTDEDEASLVATLNKACLRPITGTVLKASY